jgi:hypothetical protein
MFISAYRNDILLELKTFNKMNCELMLTYDIPALRQTSFRLSNIFFVAFFSATIDGRNLIFGHKLHIGMPYCGKCFWTRQIPNSCLPR